MRTIFEKSSNTRRQFRKNWVLRMHIQSRRRNSWLLTRSCSCLLSCLQKSMVVYRRRCRDLTGLLDQNISQIKYVLKVQLSMTGDDYELRERVI